MEKLSELEKQGFQGVDASLEHSLFEYGMAWRRNLLRHDKAEFVFYYRINGEDNDDLARFSFAIFYDFQLIRSIKEEFNWIDEDSWKSFYETMGTTESDWLKLPFGQQIYDLANHWGQENIFGANYWEGFQIK